MNILPNHDKICSALEQYLHDNPYGIQASAAYSALANHFGLSDSIIKEPNREGRSHWKNKVRTASARLVDAGVMLRPKRNCWVLADKNSLARDVNEIFQKTGKNQEQLVNTRLGQGQFRRSLDKIWDSKCAVTGCPQREFLRASHIKPWRLSNGKEKTDPNNGLLLNVVLDAAFDSYVISFEDDGTIICSSKVPEEIFSELGIKKTLSLRKLLNQHQKNYLSLHRKLLK